MGVVNQIEKGLLLTLLVKKIKNQLRFDKITANEFGGIVFWPTT